MSRSGTRGDRHLARVNVSAKALQRGVRRQRKEKGESKKRERKREKEREREKQRETDRQYLRNGISRESKWVDQREYRDVLS